MVQNIIYKGFLIAGISLFLLFINGCGETEHWLNVDFIFKNETDKKLSFFGYEGYSESDLKNIVITPDSPFDTISILAVGGYKRPVPTDCCQGVLNSVLNENGLGITVNDSVCITYFPLDIQNYEYEVIGDRHFRYTFIFTDDVLDKFIDCQEL